MSQAGFNFKASYIGEYAYSFSGGKRIGGDYAQQWAVAMDMDMGKVAGLTGGTFHLGLNLREGRNTTADYIGNKINVQEIFGDGQDFRLAQLSYQQVLFNKTLDLKAGWMSWGNDFGRTGILCDFENDAFCAHPVSLPSNSGWSDYPLAHWGGRARVNLPDDVYAELASSTWIRPMRCTPTVSSSASEGSTGVIVPVEFGKTVRLLGPADCLDITRSVVITTARSPRYHKRQLSYKGRYGG